MRRRSTAKTGRARQPQPFRQGSFRRFAAMVERFSSGYVRPLSRRLPRKPA